MYRNVHAITCDTTSVCVPIGSIELVRSVENGYSPPDIKSCIVVVTDDVERDKGRPASEGKDSVLRNDIRLFVRS